MALHLEGCLLTYHAAVFALALAEVFPSLDKASGASVYSVFDLISGELFN